jgi:hypothetical protein
MFIHFLSALPRERCGQQSLVHVNNGLQNEVCEGQRALPRLAPRRRDHLRLAMRPLLVVHL